MFGDTIFDLVCFLTMLIFCLIKKIYEILVKKNKTTQVVLFLQIFISLIILLVFKLSLFTLLCLILLVFFSHTFITDIEQYVIPYLSIFGILTLGVINLFIENNLNITVIERIISFFVFLIIWFVLSFVQNKLKKDFIGGGDLLLFCSVSLFWGGTITFIGIFIASFIALLMNLFRKEKGKFIPFGPYLVVGFLLSLLISNYLFKI